MNRCITSLMILLLASTALRGAEQAQDEFDFPDDDLEARIAAVNDGPLHFLASPIDPDVLRSENTITIKPGSLDDGWVELRQCYHNLDPIGKVEVVYRYRHLRNLRIDGVHNIGAASVREQSVQLEDVEKGASVCIVAETRNFYKRSAGSFALVNGPYHRKFFDGYFPLHVQLHIRYPQDILKVETTRPEQQIGFDIKSARGELTINAWFEGILKTEVLFSASKPER